VILGVVGIVTAASNKRTGLGVPIAGASICFLAILISVLMTIGMIGAANQAAANERGAAGYPPVYRPH
jgi:hypothetical protein